MFIVNGIVYATTPAEEQKVVGVKALDDYMLILTFASGEKRLYDAVPLLDYPAFQPLKDKAIFKAVSIEHGVVVWMDGEIDIAPETMYVDSYAYEEITA